MTMALVVVSQSPQLAPHDGCPHAQGKWPTEGIRPTSPPTLDWSCAPSSGEVSVMGGHLGSLAYGQASSGEFNVFSTTLWSLSTMV